MSALTHLACAACNASHEAQKLWNLCGQCGKPLLARYDTAALVGRFTRESLAGRGADLWRYREMLPDPGEYQPMGEGFTPLIPAPRLAKRFGLGHLYIKDESLNPTGSFKIRGMAVAVPVAKRLGARALCLPSAGNAGSAAAACGARVGLPVRAFLPEGTPEPFFGELKAYGAQAQVVAGHIGDAGRAMREMMQAEPQQGWFDLSTLKEPYRLEGKKTMGYELCEQLGGTLPDAIIYPTGGGTGLIGMWKAFAEMESLGWIGARRPKMIVAQSSGCAPIVKAFNEGSESADLWPDPRTIASGLRVPSAIGDFLILRAVRESDGWAVAVEEKELAGAVRDVGKLEGIFCAPEGAATVLALARMLDERRLDPSDRIVLFNTGTGLKYLDAL